MSKLFSAIQSFGNTNPIIQSTEIVHYQTPVLTKKSRGAVLHWKGEVFESTGKIYTRSVFWQINSAGEKSVVQKSDPVHIARTKSQPTLIDQGVFNVTSDMNKKRDNLYLLPDEDASTKLLKPMLAHEFIKHGHKIDFPCAVQPKYDGTRMVGDGNRMWSRNLKLAVEKCVEHLFFDTEGYILDGELILPQPWSFEETRSATTAWDPAKSPALIWRLYDICAPDLDFTVRHLVLQDLMKRAKLDNPSLQIIATPTFKAKNDEDVQKYFKQFTEDMGEEGLMLRNLHGGYEIDKRSYNLQKLKEFLDDEFLVLGISTNDNRTEEAQLVCKLNGIDGPVDLDDPKDVKEKTFTASIKGTREYRSEIFNNPSLVVGTTWTVKFQGYTKYGKPRFPNAVRQRDKNDE